MDVIATRKFFCEIIVITELWKDEVFLLDVKELTFLNTYYKRWLKSMRYGRFYT